MEASNEFKKHEFAMILAGLKMSCSHLESLTMSDVSPLNGGAGKTRI